MKTEDEGGRKTGVVLKTTEEFRPSHHSQFSDSQVRETSAVSSTSVCLLLKSDWLTESKIAAISRHYCTDPRYLHDLQKIFPLFPITAFTGNKFRRTRKKKQ